MLRKRINKALSKNQQLRLKYDSEKVVLEQLDSIYMTKFSLRCYCSEVVGGLKSLLEAMDIPLPSEEHDVLKFHNSCNYKVTNT